MVRSDNRINIELRRELRGMGRANSGQRRAHKDKNMAKIDSREVSGYLGCSNSNQRNHLIDQSTFTETR